MRSGLGNARNLRRAISLGILTLSLSICAYAQQEAGNKSGKRLEAKLIVLTPTACVGSLLKLRLEMTNTSQEVIKLNRAFFWNNYTLHRDEDKDDEVFFSHSWPVSTSEDIVILAPAKTYVSHTYWSLDEHWKLEPGGYTLQIKTYGTSNGVKFLLHDCKSENSLRE